MAVGTVLKFYIAKYLQLVIMHPASLLLSVNNIEKNAHDSKDDQNSCVGIADDPQGKEWVVLHPQERRYAVRPESSVTLILQVGKLESIFRHVSNILQNQLHVN